MSVGFFDKFDRCLTYVDIRLPGREGPGGVPCVVGPAVIDPAAALANPSVDILKLREGVFSGVYSSPAVYSPPEAVEHTHLAAYAVVSTAESRAVARACDYAREKASWDRHYAHQARVGGIDPATTAEQERVWSLVVAMSQP
jgi:hypothetical protein